MPCLPGLTKPDRRTCELGHDDDDPFLAQFLFTPTLIVLEIRDFDSYFVNVATRKFVLAIASGDCIIGM